jgi:hypothetical protein
MSNGATGPRQARASRHCVSGTYDSPTQDPQSSPAGCRALAPSLSCVLDPAATRIWRNRSQPARSTMCSVTPVTAFNRPAEQALSSRSEWLAGSSCGTRRRHQPLNASQMGIQLRASTPIGVRDIKGQRKGQSVIVGTVLVYRKTSMGQRRLSADKEPVPDLRHPAWWVKTKRRQGMLTVCRASQMNDSGEVVDMQEHP